MFYLKPVKSDKPGSFWLGAAIIAAGFFLFFAAASFAMANKKEAAQEYNDNKISYLKKLSIEDLLKVEITSVSKKAEKLSDAAAAVFVITGEDIRRSGAVSIPEALRMAPGLQVARIDANKWAISSRGFNGRFANKLLVLIDGRSVYTPLYSGVFWEVQDTLIEDVDRIEIIRGPGATLWGANAVNGVINIITKKTDATLGGLAVAGIGTEERSFGSARFGGKLKKNSSYRIYAKYFDRDAGVDATDSGMADDWDVFRAGFRFDWKESNQNFLTVQGDLYDGKTGQTITLASLLPPYSITFDEEAEISGKNILARLTHSFSKSSDIALQMYYDETIHKETLGRIYNDIFDIDLQHSFVLGTRHELIWGMGYRFLHDHIKGSFTFSFSNEAQDDELFSVFIQDDIALIENCLRLTVGSKYEHNDYTGSELQPGARLIWTPDERNSVWVSVSRAVRTPSRAEQDAHGVGWVIPEGEQGNPGPFPAVVSMTGNTDFDSEELFAYELGYRICPTNRFSVDIATFYNFYDSLRSSYYGAPFVETGSAPTYLSIPVIIDNKMDGEAYGVEFAADWRILPWWRVITSYAFIQMQLRINNAGDSNLAESIEGENPHNQVSVRSLMDLPWHLELDLWVRYIDNLPDQKVGSYVGFDTRFAWKPHKNLEVSIIGQNLFDGSHPEFMPEALDVSPTETERSIYGKITWSY